MQKKFHAQMDDLFRFFQWVEGNIQNLYKTMSLKHKHIHKYIHIVKIENTMLR
jgi:hypothetical protein